MNETHCCPEYAAPVPPRPAHRRARPRRRHDRLRLRRGDRVRGRGCARPRPSWSCCRCAARPTGCRWSSRTPTRSTTPPGPTSPSPPTSCWPRTACSACTRRSRRCCRSGRPASWPPSTRPGCPRPTARTSPPWRRSRTPTPARGPGGLAQPAGRHRRRRSTRSRGCNLGGGVAPASLYGPQPVMSAGSVDAMGDRRRRRAASRTQRMRSLHTLGTATGHRLGRAMRSTFDALAGVPARQGQPDAPENAAAYPGNDLGRALAEVARVIAATSASRWSPSTRATGTTTPTSAPSSGAACSQNAADLGRLDRRVLRRPRRLGATRSRW